MQNDLISAACPRQFHIQYAPHPRSTQEEYVQLYLEVQPGIREENMHDVWATSTLENWKFFPVMSKSENRPHLNIT